MFEKIRKMKNQKGFTLVELIVVLVILAILAAMLVPALTGYIDKANKQKIQAVTRQVVMAAQAELSETYSTTTLTNGKITIVSGEKEDVNDGIAGFGKKVVKLAEVGSYDDSSNQYKLTNGITNITINYDADGNIVDVTLVQGTKTCVYSKSAGTYTVTPE